MKTNWWVDSGMASQAAHELAWFVIIVFVGLGVLIWRDIKNEGKQQDKPRASRNVHKGDKNESK